jgi:hypothetical protein
LSEYSILLEIQHLILSATRDRHASRYQSRLTSRILLPTQQQLAVLGFLNLTSFMPAHFSRRDANVVLKAALDAGSLQKNPSRLWKMLNPLHLEATPDRSQLADILEDLACYNDFGFHSHFYTSWYETALGKMTKSEARRIAYELHTKIARGMQYFKMHYRLRTTPSRSEENHKKDVVAIPADALLWFKQYGSRVDDMHSMVRYLYLTRAVDADFMSVAEASTFLFGLNTIATRVRTLDLIENGRVDYYVLRDSSSQKRGTHLSRKDLERFIHRNIIVKPKRL